MEQDDFLAQLAYENLDKILARRIFECNLAPDDVSKLFTMTEFWPQILHAWAQLHYINDVDPQHIGEQIIWYNSHIKVANKPFLWKKTYAKGLVHVKQLFANNKMLGFTDAQDKFGLNFLQMRSLIEAIPKPWKHAMKEASQIMNYWSANLMRNCNLTKMYVHNIGSNAELMQNTYLRWQMRLKMDIDYEGFIKLFRCIKKVTNNGKLQSFQFRLLHLAIVYNTQLKKWKIKESDLCSLCNEKTEIMEHLFFECKKMQPLLSSVEQLTEKNLKKEVKLCITIKNVLWNRVHKSPGHLSNFLVLILKQFVYAARCQGLSVNSLTFLKKIEEYRRYEFYHAKETGNCKTYYRKWQNIVIGTVSKGNDTEEGQNA